MSIGWLILMVTWLLVVLAHLALHLLSNQSDAHHVPRTPPPARFNFPIGEPRYVCVDANGWSQSGSGGYNSVMEIAKKKTAVGRRMIIVKLQPYEAVEIPITVTRMD